MADGVLSNLSRMIDQVGKEKGIDKDLVIDAVIQGMLVAARKKYGTYREIEAQYNEDSGEVELYEFKEVVTDDEFVDELVEIKLTEALELDPEAQVNDSIGAKLEATDLGRIAAQTAKQIITQKVRDAERDIIFNEFEQRRGDIASGIVRRVDRGTIVVDLGRTEAYMPYREQIPGENYNSGDRIQGFLLDVRQTNRGPQIIMSRADEKYMRKLFEQEVPEIFDDVIEIVVAAREPGQRAKMAVRCNDPSIDPVGACVGMKGSRVQNVIQELQGERIDIIHYDDDIVRFVCNALAPAEISKVLMDEDSQQMEVIVDEDQLSLAIGRRGQNVRLAHKLTGWKLDIVSTAEANARTAEAIFNLMLIPNMSETMAQNIFQSGFSSFQSIAESDIESVQTIPGYDTEESATGLVDACKALVEKYKSEGVEIPKIPQAKAVQEATSGTGSAKLDAEARLQQELEQLNAESEEESVEEVAEEVAEEPAESEEVKEATETEEA